MATIITFPVNPRARKSVGGLSDTERKLAELTEQYNRLFGHEARTAPVHTGPKSARGTVAWAQSVIDAHNRLRTQLYEARIKAKERRRVEFPKPKFVPDGKGYENIRTPEARRIIAEKMPDFGPEDLKLIAALKAHDANNKAWQAATATIEQQCGLIRMETQNEALREDWALAEQIIRDNREERFQ